MLPSIAKPVGVSTAVAMPCIARHTSKKTREGSRGTAASPASIDHNAYQARPYKNRGLWPMISPTRPATRMKVPAVREKAEGNQSVTNGEVLWKVVPMYSIGAID